MYAVDRTARAAQAGLLSTVREALLRRRARAVSVAELAGCGEGELVRVRARVRAEALLHGALHATPGVFRRLTFTLDGAAWVHERGLDFRVVDGGAEALVLVGGARLVAATEELIDYPAHCFDGLEVALGGRRSLPARERVLLDGALVEVIGQATTVADGTAASAGYRALPRIAALRSSREQALVLTPVD